jgi:GDP-4-dehydro-6-deoxy-D-mannose reductase
LNPIPRLVFSSSCYVYGVVPQDHPIVTEDSPCDPYSGYGVTKRTAEQILQSVGARKNLDFVIARAFQHTGPRQAQRMIVPDWVRQLTTGRADPIRVICLDTFLDLSDVRDIVRAYRDLARAGRSGRIYNVGSGICRRGGDLLDLLRQMTDASRPVVELAPGRRQHPIADISRIRDEVGWRPEIPLEQTLRDVVNDWRNKIGATR